MYLDITSVSYNAKRNLVLIEGIDLDKILMSSWDTELTDKAEVVMKFDLTNKGSRIYLYKIVKTHITEEYKTIEEALMKLSGKMLNISSNFISKTKG